jgi:subtilase family serine protease
MISRAFVALLSLVVTVSGLLVPHASRPNPPPGFVHYGAAQPSEAITLRVALVSANTAGLEAKLQRISNPMSPEYGQWLTAGT